MSRKCKCGCGIDISHKHLNAKFLNAKHKDRFHNSQPDRIERSSKYAKPRIVAKRVAVSRLEELLDAKIWSLFANISSK